MNGTKLDGYCGLYCGACDIFRLSEKAGETGAKAEWQEMPAMRRAPLLVPGELPLLRQKQ